MDQGFYMASFPKWLLLYLYPLVAFLFAWSVILAVSVIFNAFALNPSLLVFDSSPTRRFYTVFVGCDLAVFALPYWSYVAASKNFYGPMSVWEVVTIMAKSAQHSGVVFFWVFLCSREMSLLFLPAVMFIGIWKGVKDKRGTI